MTNGKLQSLFVSAKPTKTRNAEPREAARSRAYLSHRGAVPFRQALTMGTGTGCSLFILPSWGKSQLILSNCSSQKERGFTRKETHIETE